MSNKKTNKKSVIDNSFENLDFNLTEKESNTILKFVKDIKTEFKPIDNGWKRVVLSTRFIIFEYIITYDKKIDDNNINFFESSDTEMDDKLKLNKEFIEMAKQRIIEQTTIIKKQNYEN